MKSPLTEEEILSRVNNARVNLRDEWNKKAPKSTLDVQAFYEETDGYIYDLYTWTHDPRMWDLFDKVFKPGMRVIDYGCGICDVAIYLAKKGCYVTAVDLPKSHTFHFGMWRVYQRGLGNMISFDFEPDKNTNSFDAAVSIDVLEHLPFPLLYVVQLGRLLKNRSSPLFVTPTFGDATDEKLYPMHLDQNNWLKENFGNAMISLGFKPEYVDKKYYPLWFPTFKDPEEDPAEPNSKEDKPSEESQSQPEQK